MVRAPQSDRIMWGSQHRSCVLVLPSQYYSGMSLEWTRCFAQHKEEDSPAVPPKGVRALYRTCWALPARRAADFSAVRMPRRPLAQCQHLVLLKIWDPFSFWFPLRTIPNKDGPPILRNTPFCPVFGSPKLSISRKTSLFLAGPLGNWSGRSPRQRMQIQHGQIVAAVAADSK